MFREHASIGGPPRRNIRARSDLGAVKWDTDKLRVSGGVFLGYRIDLTGKFSWGVEHFYAAIRGQLIETKEVSIGF
jgi:hypothetical protein